MMGDVLAFIPRPTVAAPIEPAPIGEAEIRTRLGEALQTALDAADHIIAVLDRMDGDTDTKNGADAGPALTAPENYRDQVVWLRKNDHGRETEALEAILPVIAAKPHKTEVLAWPLPWSGSSNVISAAGVALLGMMAGH